MDFMVDAFLCLVLDVFGLASKCSPFGWIPFPWVSFQGPEHSAFDLDSRFLVASRSTRDLLVSAKHLLIEAIRRRQKSRVRHRAE